MTTIKHTATAEATAQALASAKSFRLRKKIIVTIQSPNFGYGEMEVGEVSFQSVEEAIEYAARTVPHDGTARVYVRPNPQGRVLVAEITR